MLELKGTKISTGSESLLINYLHIPPYGTPFPPDGLIYNCATCRTTLAFNVD